MVFNLSMNTLFLTGKLWYSIIWDYVCVIGSECCPTSKRGSNCYEQYGISKYETVRKECEVKSLPTASIGIILETLERKMLSCKYFSYIFFLIEYR